MRITRAAVAVVLMVMLTFSIRITSSAGQDFAPVWGGDGSIGEKLAAFKAITVVCLASRPDKKGNPPGFPDNRQLQAKQVLYVS